MKATYLLRWGSTSGIGHSADPVVLERFLTKAVCWKDGPNTQFTHFDIVKGLECSARLLLVEPMVRCPDAILFDHPKSPREVAEELVKLIQEARYDPIKSERVGQEKGWFLAEANLTGQRAILAMAQWVP